MKRSRFSGEQIIRILKEQEAGMPMAEVLDSLKKALAQRAQNAEMDHHLGGVTEVRHMNAAPDLPRNIPNFRDFGGCDAAENGRIRSGRLFRSSHFGNVDEEDKSRLDQLGISLLVDLRVPDERARQPNRWPDDNCTTVALNDNIPDFFIALLKAGTINLEVANQYMEDCYRTIPFDPSYKALFARTFAEMGQQRGGLVIHCLSGKDRTGILSALVLHCLGASKDAIEADFLKTNAPPELGPRITEYRRMISAIPSADVTDDAITVMAGVSSDLIWYSFASLTDQFGTVDAYLEQALGVTKDVKKALRTAYLC